MENGYDENLCENVFFKTLHNNFEEVFHRAVSENWIICVPCSQSLDHYDVNEWNILTHILVPSDELPDTHFVSLNNEEITICDKLVKLKNHQSVPILFTELFYSNKVRYEIFCLEQPLNYHLTTGHPSNPRIYFVKTLEECIDLLTLESTNELATKKLDEVINQFLFLSSKDYFLKSVEQQVAFMKNIYNRCLQIVLQDKKVKAKAKVSRMFMENIRIAVESYVLHNIYSIVMKGLISNMTEEIGQFNRALRNLASIQLQDLTVENAVLDSIPRARNELSRLHSYSTVLGKLNCLKRCINLITSKQSDKLCVDELLPILVFLVVKSGITTWIAQLQYVREFNFSHSDQNQASESSFLATTLEAVITFIKSGMFFKSMYFGCKDQLKMIEPDDKIANVCSYICSRSKLFWKTSNASLLRIFQYIYEGDTESVASEFEEKKHENADSLSQPPLATKLEFCHPLCSCDKCEKLHQSLDHEQTPLEVNSTNESGCSPLHVATCYGRSTLINWFLNRGANPNCVDFAGSTPLHCAALHGYQNAVLLLMYADAKLDMRDDDGNQPLHCACMNGHVDCVKALLYFAEHTGLRLDVNAMNKDGDTPLHLAVKYYYKEIAEILLNYNASVSIKNKHGRNVFELTQSLPIRDVLNEKYVSVVNLLNASPTSLKCFSPSYPELDRSHSRSLPPHIRYADELPLAKHEYGVQPTTAEALKNVEKLFNAVRERDLKIVKRLLGSSVADGSIVQPEATQDQEQPLSPSYKCHPLCQCENCMKDTQQPDSEEDHDECIDDFRKIDTLSVNICNADGVTALHVACRCGNVEAMRFFLDAGAKMNVRTYKQLLTPLHMAALSNQLPAVKLLLEHSQGGCDINLVDRRGNTVLHCACIAGNARLVELLLKYNPDTEIRNDRGKMAVNESEENLSYMIMQMLKSLKSVATEELLS